MTLLRKYATSDTELERSNWRFPAAIKLRPLRDLEDDDFLTDHTIDRSYDDATIRFKLLAADAPRVRADGETPALPLPDDVLQVMREQGWISAEYEHLWRRNGGGSAALASGKVLSFLLQTPRDEQSFCSLSLVNIKNDLVGGLIVHDINYDLDALLKGQAYLNKHAKAPRDFTILPFSIFMHHVDETFIHVQRLSQRITVTEHELASSEDVLEESREFKEDYKRLNDFNLEHLRLSTRSKFELELGENLHKYIDQYCQLHELALSLDTSYVDDLREKINQQLRYANQVQHDLEFIPKRIKNQSKAIFSFIAQRDNKTTIELAKINRRIAEETRKDNLLNIEIAKSTAQVAEETRQDSAAMKTIAVLTLTFLPGTGIASFFSMNNMFNFNPDEGESIVSGWIWLYFAITVPLTILIFALWGLWFKVSQRRYTIRHEEGLRDVEKELKLRVKSATMTW
ncbi:hypothetical protein AMS68_002570 [Peltaster fructicola]|uniref:Uncharacterized protein n=1 Tax=Peltaster fructicola TaxID=286661 RepID=A0A6H0XQR9_9PEZI|nr:hypothetical protein AMS68_002570 [Peltaster fructicola]